MAKHALPPRFTITNAITAALTQIERARGFLEAATLSEEWVRTMGERALVLEAHHTPHIEGTHLTLDQAERLPAGEPVPTANPDDVRKLLNYRQAFEFVAGYLDSGAPITEGLSTQLREVKPRGERAIHRDVLAQEYGLSERQARALGHVLEHGRLTIQEYEALCPDVNRRTLQRDLGDLVDKGLLNAEGATNRMEYRFRGREKP